MRAGLLLTPHPVTTANASFSSSFYIAGGTLRSDSPSYVERQADRELYDGLIKGEFCYVLINAFLMARGSWQICRTGRCTARNKLSAVVCCGGASSPPSLWRCSRAEAGC